VSRTQRHTSYARYDQEQDRGQNQDSQQGLAHECNSFTAFGLSLLKAFEDAIPAFGRPGILNYRAAGRLSRE
jgi:hypothetical protein